MQNLTLICSLQRLRDPGSYGFSLEVNGEQVDGFVVRRDNECFAYRNSCPHTGSPLDWVDHQFLDVEGALIQCAVHDARFLIESGECVMGPCAGDSLEALSIRVQDDNVYLLARISLQGPSSW
ncbi:MAG: Rieske 2Fe-2S domain-containing protein [Gammaproteobacteria bacterium]|nr:Rieske 2Fe-2S domain-containing protein [Gammaproteobacteria bacterium]